MDGVDALDTAPHTNKSGYHDDSDEVNHFFRRGGPQVQNRSVSFSVYNQDLTEAKEGKSQKQQLNDCESWPAQQLGHNFQNRNFLVCK